MKNSRILLSSVLAGILYSGALASPFATGGTLSGDVYTGSGDVKVYYDNSSCGGACDDLNTQKSKIIGSNNGAAKVELNGKSKTEQVETGYITGAFINTADKSANDNEVRLNYVKITGTSSAVDPNGAGHVIGGLIGNLQYNNKTANIANSTASVKNNNVYINGSTLTGTYEENYVLFLQKIGSYEIPGANARVMNMAVLGGAKLVDNGSASEEEGVLNNHVNITDSKIFGVVAGGFSSANVVKGNSVYIENSKLSGILEKDSSIINIQTRQPIKTLGDGDVVGGMSVKGLATDNTITLKNVINNNNGDSAGLENHITILGSFSGDNTKATQNNKVFIESGSLDLSGGLEGAIIAGFGMGGAQNSQVSIKNAVITTAANSGDDKADPSYMKGGINAGVATGGNVVNNIVTIENSTINGGDITGGRMVGSGTFGNGNVEKNEVSIKNSSINADIYGGQNHSKDANGNKIEVIGGQINSKQIVGAKSAKGSANNNQVNIQANVSGDIIGGYGAIDTNNNQVSVNGDVGGSIYAGFDGTDAKGSNNTINLLGELKNVKGNVKVGSQNGAGNSLNINTNNPLKINGAVGGAQNINISVANINPGDAVLSVGSINVEKADINADLKLGASFRPGDSLRLISGNVIGMANSANAAITQGGAIEYSIEIDKNDLTKELQINAKGLSPITKTLSEGVMGGAMILASAGDSIAGQGVKSAINSTNSATSGVSVIAPFGSVMAGANRVETGSYVKSYGINLALGAALGTITDSGKLTIGPFVEFGKSSYTTHNDFGAGDAKGDGDTKYIGIGALARYDFGGTEISRPYIEGSARFGRNYNSYENKNMKDGFGNHAKYDMNTNYFGTHVGVGYALQKGAHSVDVYAKYFYTRLNGANIDIMGLAYEFGAVNSHRLLTGAKYQMEIETNNKIKVAPFAGAGLDYEFKGDGNAYTSGFAVDSPTLKGGSLMMEAGLNISNAKGFSADFGLRGYTGKRRGINGLFNVKLEF